MTAEHWSQVKTLFTQCLEVSRAEREVFLARQETVAEVHNEVLRLLSNFDQASQAFLQPPELFRRIFPATGQVLNAGDQLAERFDIVRFLGRGGMGEVYEAYDREIRETVAVKVLCPVVESSDDASDRFRRELQLARRVTHPNICRLFDINRHQFPWGFVEFLSMEYLHGSTLSALLKDRGRFTPQEAQPLLEQLLAGLQAVHDAGIVHRDLKPGNVMVVPGEPTGTPRVVLMDFGLAKGGPETLGELTQSHARLGTLAYMAPEQLAGSQVCRQTDLYALGTIWQEMLHGKKGSDESSGAQPPNIPATWARTIQACLNAEVSHRPSSVNEVLAALTETSSRGVVRRLFTRRSAMIAGGVSLAAAAGFAYELGFLKGPLFDYGSTLLVASAGESDEKLTAPVVLQIRASLRQSQRFLVWDPAKLADVWSRMGRTETAVPSVKDWREIAIREGIRYVLYPSVTRVGDGVSLAFRLERVEGDPNADAWQESFQAPDPARIFDAVDAGCRWIRKLAGESQTEVSRFSVAPQAVTTPNILALQEFTHAEEKMKLHDRDGAVLSFTEATRLDPEFTMAWMRLGDVQTALGRDNDAFLAWQKAEESSRARPLTRREDLRFRSMLASDCASYAAAESLFKEYSAYFPTDWYGPFFRSFPLLLLGRPEEAIVEISRCTAFPEVKPLALMQLSFNRMYTLDRSAAEEPIRILKGLGLGTYAGWAQAVIAHVAGDTEQAIDAIGHAAADPWLVSVSIARMFKAIIFADAGQYPEALDQLQRGAKEDALEGARDRWAAKLISITVLHEMLGRPPEAQASLRSLGRIPCGPEHTGWAGVLSARLGNRVEAERLLASIPSQLNYPKFQIPRLRILAELKISEGQASEGLELLRKAAKLEPSGFGCEYLAFALEQQGWHAEALMEYRESLRSKCFQLRLATPAPAGSWNRCYQAVQRLEKVVSKVIPTKQ